MTDPQRLRIAYLCAEDPRDKWSYSGGNARIFDIVQTHIGDATIVDNSWHSLDFIRRLIEWLPERLKIRAKWRLHILFARIIGWQLSRRLARQEFDVIFCAYSFHSLLNVRKPPGAITVFTSDATPTTYRNSEIGRSFGSFLPVSRLLDRFIRNAERKVCQRTDLLLWPSQWLKDSADALYDLADAKSIHLPWGANVAPPDRTHLTLDRILGDPVQLLLVGRDWFAKGGPLTFAVLNCLRGQGIDARLTVIGCTPPAEHVNEAVDVFGFLDRTIPEQQDIFTGLYANADFLVMPSYESYGFAFCEASAYGVPSLGLRVGGVPIVEGVNGHALPEGASVGDFARMIAFYRDNQADYTALRQAARQYYEDALNWETWAVRARTLIHERLGQESTEPHSYNA